jgi:hypothetical protein
MRHYHLVDTSKHPHDSKFSLKRHIHRTKQDIKHHIGFHEFPEARHRVSIHHHDGKHHYYGQEFPSRQEAEEHVTKHFKFMDAYPQTTHIAHEIHKGVKAVAPHLHHLAPVAEMAGAPILAAGLTASKHLIKAL